MNTTGTISTKSSKVVPNKRAVGYFRVSSEEQVEGYSISAQERAYRLYCETHGYTSVGEYRDEGKSARTDNIKRRPGFAQMLEDVQQGLFDVIVVHKMDRFSLSLRVAVQAFEQLGKSNVGLASVSEPNLDYSSPQGKLFMHMLWALAQFYSDNLAQEVRKGKVERRQQGFYNGLLPFGVVKGKDGVPTPDRRNVGQYAGHTNYDGLLLLFQMAADAETCKTIAVKLNTLGYRTTGNRGNNLFTKDTVLGIVRNRFYLGELPDGEYPVGQSRRGHYTKGFQGKHQEFVPGELWEAAQIGIALNSRRTGRPPTATKAHTYSLSGLLTCSYCGGKLHIHSGPDGKAKLYCYRRGQGIASDCKQRSTFLSIYESQVEQYLSSIRLPQEYQQMVLASYKREDERGPGFDKQRQDIENKLKRLKNLYTWGDLSSEEYRLQRDQMRSELAALPQATSSREETIERLAYYLQNIGEAWRSADQAQRNKLAKTLFESIRVEDRTIKGVIPQIEFTPLLVLSDYQNKNFHLTECQGGSRKSGSDRNRSRDFSIDMGTCNFIIHIPQASIRIISLSQSER